MQRTLIDRIVALLNEGAIQWRLTQVLASRFVTYDDEDRRQELVVDFSNADGRSAQLSKVAIFLREQGARNFLFASVVPDTRLLSVIGITYSEALGAFVDSDARDGAPTWFGREHIGDEMLSLLRDDQLICKDTQTISTDLNGGLSP